MRDGGELERERAVDRGFLYQLRLKLQKLLARCPCSEVSANFQSTFGENFDLIIRSVVRLRLDDMPRLQMRVEINQDNIAALRVSYLCKDLDMPSFRRRVLKLHQTGEVSRRELDLMAAVQTAAADILYRVYYDAVALAARTDSVVSGAKMTTDDEMRILSEYQKILSTMAELHALCTHAETSLSNIYCLHSVPKRRRCAFASWFTLVFWW
jgi:hypothetical protein